MIARAPAGFAAGYAPVSRRGDAGVTLVEVLVVLVMIGVMAGAVGLGLGSLDRGGGAQREAVLLAARLDRSAEYSLLSGRPTALEWTEDGYLFEVQTAEGWGTHPLAALAQRHNLPRGLRIAAQGTDDKKYLISPDMLPPASGPLRLSLRQDGQIDPAWRILHDGASARIVDEASR